jgi:hypothetical protein
MLYRMQGAPDATLLVQSHVCSQLTYNLATTYDHRPLRNLPREAGLEPGTILLRNDECASRFAAVPGLQQVAIREIELSDESVVTTRHVVIWTNPRVIATTAAHRRLVQTHLDSENKTASGERYVTHAV